MEYNLENPLGKGSMRRFIDKISIVPRPLLVVPLVCAVGDAFVIFYCYLQIQEPSLALQIIDTILEHQNIDPRGLDEWDKRAIFNTAAKPAIYVSMALLVLFHGAIYFFFSRKKNFSRNYVLLLTALASPGYLFSSLSLLSSHPIGALLAAAAAAVYGQLFLATKTLVFPTQKPSLTYSAIKNVLSGCSLTLQSGMGNILSKLFRCLSSKRRCHGSKNMQDKIIQLIADATKTDKTKITPESSFIDDLNCDSLDLVELIMKIEDEFNIEVPEEDAEKLKKVSDVIAYLEQKN